MKAFCSLALVLASIWAVFAQGEPSADPARSASPAAVDRLKFLLNTPVEQSPTDPVGGLDAAQGYQQALSLYSSNLALYQQQNMALQASNLAVASKEAEFEVFNYSYHERIYNWQFISTIIIFWVVILIVLAGIAFSGVQFYIAMLHEKQMLHHTRAKSRKAANNPPSGEAAGNDLGAPTELEVSLTGLKVKSQILGVVILALSIVFFYLYLSIVYPIKPVEEPVRPNPAAPSSPTAP